MTAKPVQELFLLIELVFRTLTVLVVPETGVPKFSCDSITLPVYVALFVGIVNVSARFECFAWVVLNAREPRFKINWIFFATFPEPVAVMPREVHYTAALVAQVASFEFISHVFAGWHSSDMAFKPSVEVLMVVEVICEDICCAGFLFFDWVAIDATLAMPVAIKPAWLNIHTLTVALQVAASVFRAVHTTTVGSQSHCVAMEPFFKVHVVLALAIALVLVPKTVEPILVSNALTFCVSVTIQI